MNESAQFSGFHQGVRERAYALWEREGRPFGRHVEHWRVSEEAARAETLDVAPVKKATSKAASRKKAAFSRANAGMEMSAGA